MVKSRCIAFYGMSSDGKKDYLLDNFFHYKPGEHVQQFLAYHL